MWKGLCGGKTLSLEVWEGGNLSVWEFREGDLFSLGVWVEETSSLRDWEGGGGH